MMSLEHIVGPANNEKLKNQHQKKKKEENIKGAQEATERTPDSQRENNLSNKISKIVLNYNPECKINESIRI